MHAYGYTALCVEVKTLCNAEYQWRTFKVFNEHLEMKKKIKKSVLGHSLAVNAKNRLYLYCFLR